MTTYFLVVYVLLCYRDVFRYYTFLDVLEMLHVKVLYYGGPILTMEYPMQAEAVLINDGIIDAVGELNDLRSLSKGAAEIDLQGCTLMPSFIDSHGHFSGLASSMLQISLDQATNFDDIIFFVSQYIQHNHIPKGQWVIGKGYDHNLLNEHRHPGISVLDQAAPDNPLVIQHKSGHMGVFNSVALRLLQVTVNTAEPAGGVIGTDNGMLNGYMEENAFITFFQKVPLPKQADLLNAYCRAQNIYASHGITTIQEGMMVEPLIPFYKMLLSQSLLNIDVVVYSSFESIDAIYSQFQDNTRYYQNHMRLGGCKLFLDGSPQGRTAWMRSPYHKSDTPYYGYGSLTDSELEDALEVAFKEKLQPIVHCNGDAAAAQYLGAIRYIEAKFPEFRYLRPVMVHAQLLDVDQMADVHQLGIIPSFFIAHIYHWGDVHIKNFGLARASRISAARAALNQEVLFTFHQDTPVIEPDMLETVWCAVNRVTKKGIVLGANQKIPVLEALRAITINAAYQYSEENQKGSIRLGKFADFVLLDSNPLTVSPEELGKINVIETIKQGNTIYHI